MNAEQKMLQLSMEACAQRVAKLRQSVEKLQHLFPLPLEQAALLTDEQEESIDALILRYSQCVSMIQDQIFRGVAYLEQEDISDKSMPTTNTRPTSSMTTRLSRATSSAPRMAMLT
jgi:hypothetical protein